MNAPLSTIPHYTLYGENSTLGLFDGFSQICHIEPIVERSSLYQWHIKPHVHELFVQLLWIEQGGGTVNIDQFTHRIEAPFFVLVPSQTVHGFEFDEHTDGVVITIHERSLTQHINMVSAHLLSICKQSIAISLKGLADQSAIMTAITQALNLSTHHVSTQQSLTQLGLLCALLAHIDSFKVFTHMPLHMPPKSLIKFQTMLSQQFNANHTPSHYAQALNISTGQLTRICKEFTGKPTRVLIQERLLLEALRELIYTHDTIGSIAKKLGFKDENYFGRFFRKHTSYSPSQYRFKHWQKL